MFPAESIMPFVTPFANSIAIIVASDRIHGTAAKQPTQIIKQIMINNNGLQKLYKSPTAK